MLEERERDGVTIDVCQQCRGIWLDRGELERILSRAVEEQDALERRNGYEGEEDNDHYRQRDRIQENKRSDREDLKSPDGRGRKRRWYESLTDIFD
jgi:Zn-finger nucleic acid-binding protein